MFITCIPCLRTRGFIKEITNHIKGLSLKVVGVKEQTNRSYSKKVYFNQLLEEAAKRSNDTVAIEEVKEEEENEWIAEPEPGVLITLVQLPHGGNLLKKISFSKEVFDAWQAESWWSKSWERIVELYSISQISSPQTPYSSDPENQTGADKSAESSGQGNSWYQRSVSRDDGSVEIRETDRGSKAEWVVEDEPGVFLTLRSLPDRSRELLRVELMEEKFGQVKAIVWWEENKERLEKLYSKSVVNLLHRD